MKTTIILPIINEIDGIKAILPKINKDWFDQIIFVDGGSTDGSIEYLRACGYFIVQQKNKGFRSAYFETLPFVTSDVIVTFSIDGNCLPEKLPLLIDKMKEGYDMVVVSRYAEGAKSDDDDIITGFGNWFYPRIVNILYGTKFTDVLGIYRAVRKDRITELDLDKIDNDWDYVLMENILGTQISWEVLMCIRCAKRKLKFTEIPGDEPNRIGGVRKVKLFKFGLGHLVQIIRELFIWH